jgi:hypothetical protein
MRTVTQTGRHSTHKRKKEESPSRKKWGSKVKCGKYIRSMSRQLISE